MHIITQAAPSGTIQAIPAKAHAHRALIAAALSNSPSTLRIALYSKDIDATITSLCGLGARIEKTATGVTVSPIGYEKKSSIDYEKKDTTGHEKKSPLDYEKKVNQDAIIDAHESGTTLRLLLPVGATLGTSVKVSAAGRLPERPLEPLKSQMEAHGVQFSEAKPPFTMTGHLQGGTFNLAGNISSQFFSGLLLAAPHMAPILDRQNQEPVVTIHSTTALQSRDYVELTIGVMQDFGVTVTKKGDTFIVNTEQEYQGCNNYAIEGDWSNSAIWIVAAALTGQVITITGLQRHSVQADRRIMDVVKRAGLAINWVPNSNTHELDLHCQGKATKPLSVDLEQMPDLLPVLAALACGIKGKSEFINGARLRLKESDRLDAVTNLVNDLGGTAYCVGDNLYIEGTGHLTGGQGHCINDHRLVMAGTLMALISNEPVTLKDSEAISKSYPLFFNHWNQLGGHANEL